MKRIFTSGSMGTQVGSLLVYTGISGPAHPPKEKYSLKPVIVACVEQATITALRQNISLWEGVLVIDLVYLLDSRRQQQL